MEQPEGWTPSTYYFTESAETILMLLTPTRLCGLLRSPPPPEPTGVLAIFFKTSSPLINRPKAVYWRSRNEASPSQIKNWEPAEFGSELRAMERTPDWCEWSLNSALMV